MNRWYVAQTHPNGEEKAAWHLRRQDFSVYLPRFEKRRRHARKLDWVKAPLFPRYLFIEMDPEQARWRCINSTVGISMLVCHGGRPAPVPPGIVEDISAREDGKGLIRMDLVRPFKPGEKVQITSGAMSDRTGVFQCAVDEDRVALLLELLGRQVSVRVPLAAVEACAS